MCSLYLGLEHLYIYIYTGAPIYIYRCSIYIYIFLTLVYIMGLNKSTLIHRWHCDASWALTVAH